MFVIFGSREDKPVQYPTNDSANQWANPINLWTKKNRVSQKYRNGDEAERFCIQSMILERNNPSPILLRMLQRVDYIMDDMRSYSKPTCKYGYEGRMRHCLCFGDERLQ
ncbi:unnamed protein product [Nezara viridula]|uniref:Uncharacterized protein n=1 Tax=Nezara viridula TaxID=85310 RepID=A0A9P0HHC7_NEZVI|nr:unnamed protein product [Nezara viridula]